ncbi:hypothetical protein BD289DRAFT_449137 [Coniella lustricola]|uniref:Uncharacterized protein n=1 Tax=Coniella lustricola TaxID=2025994 RepID=A0A2T3ANT7_9PEZI|nr:hypothetical protein BD289DRAFT_449137 [Coniella lustricola]
MTPKSIIKPLTQASLLATLLYAPPDLLERYLGPRFAQSIWPKIFKPLVKTLIGLGILKTINRALNAWATNNWRISSSPPQGEWDWPNEIAVVTGGCSGIGLALVEGLTSKGVRTAVLDICEPPPSLQANSKAFFFSCDVSSLSSVIRAAEAYTTQQFVPGMVRRNKGHVVTLASLASHYTLTGCVSYSASKAGAMAFHEGLGSELKHVYKAPGVVTSIVHPYFVRTPMIDPIQGQVDKVDKVLSIQDVVDPILRQIFSGRGGQLLLPKSLSHLSSLRGWPNWLQEFVRDTYARNAVKTLASHELTQQQA